MENKQSRKINKRQALREERAKQAQRQRILIIGGIALFVIVIIGLIIVTSQGGGAGDVAAITPDAYKNENGVKLGDPNAKVVIDVFEDFECSHCKSFNTDTEPLIIANLVDTGMALYVFHNFPFLTETDSKIAANGAMCAAEQNSLYNYKKVIFANVKYATGEFTDKKMIAFADSLGLKMDVFKQCVNEHRYQSAIDADLALGEKMGVQGTPSVFVNGKDISPGLVPSFDQIRAAVEAALNP